MSTAPAKNKKAAAAAQIAQQPPAPPADRESSEVISPEEISRAAREIAADDNPAQKLADLRSLLAQAEQAVAAGGTDLSDEPIVRVYHQGKAAGTFTHGPHTLNPGGFAEVPESVANLWRSHVSFGQPIVILADEIRSSVKDQLVKDKEELNAQNQELKAQLENAQKLLAALKSGTTVDQTPPPPPPDA